MPTGWEMLGDAIGGIGGVDETAYETGRLRAAQTESALGEARKRQLEALALDNKQKARSRVESDAIAQGAKPEDARLLGDLVTGEGGADYAAGMKGMATGQEMDFRNVLGDPGADLGDQFAAGQAVQGKVLPRYDAIGSGGYTDVTHPELGIQNTPLGEAMIGSDQALTGLRNTQAAAGGFSPNSGGGAGGGVSATAMFNKGLMQNPQFNPDLPVSVDNPRYVQDPGVVPPLGSRERQVVNRVLNAALNTATDLETITGMSSGANLGVLGTGLGATPGTSIFDAVAGDMKRSIAPSEVIDYNSVLGGFSNQLRTMEMMGMQGAASLAAQYDTLAFTPQDTIHSKMFKMAGVRQIVENATETILATPGMDENMKRLAQHALEGVRKAVPYTRQDVLTLERMQKENPGMTLKQVIAHNRTAGIQKPGVAPPAAPGAPVPTGADDEGWIDKGNGIRIRLKPGQ